VLLGRRQTVPRRVRAVVLATLAAAAPAALWYAGAKVNWWDWPKASGPVGVSLGLLGGLIVYFEMALAPRKWFRGRRFGAARAWMKWHVWLGLACLPVIVIHSGFAFGGWLSATTMVLFLIVIASGVYGLILQQWIPKKLYDDTPNETVAAQTDVAMETHYREAALLVDTEKDTRLRDFFHGTVEPYLLRGKTSGSPLASAAESGVLFARVRAVVPTAVEPIVNRLESFVSLRRQWDRQVRLTWWLHSWMIVHLPLSVAMTGLMTGHAILAMRWS
jgi:hypothetical protein